jgi:Zn-dependent protease
MNSSPFRRSGGEVAAAHEGAPDGGDYDDYPEPGAFTLSGTELLHLALSIIVLTIAFAFAFTDSRLIQLPGFGGQQGFARAIEIMPYSALIVVLGFALHELSHKVVAQGYAMWAEFRASAGGLIIGLGFGVLTGFVFAAPGAVHIYGSRDDFGDERDFLEATGKISVVGPLVNIVIAIGSIAAWIYVFGGRGPQAGGVFVMQLMAFVNAFLAVFNMLPVMPLDGAKVLAWNKLIYLVVGGFAVFLLWFTAFGGYAAVVPGR